MERHDVLAMMTALKLAGMRAAYDDILADGLKRRHPVQQIIGTLLQTEVADKQARSIKYQMTSAKLPTAKELADFDFATSPVNEPLIQEIATGGFLEGKRNIVLVGGTGAPARPISPSPSPAPVSERAPVAAATTSSTWSTISRPNSVPDARAAPQTSSSDATSSSSTNLAICPSPRPAGSCSSTS